MIENFDEFTYELSEEEKKLIPILIKGFQSHDYENPITASEIVLKMNVWLESNNFNIKLSEPRLRKCVNYIRSTSIIPLIATSKGYFVSYDTDIISSQVKSLTQRANSIYDCAEGLSKFLNKR